MDGIIYLITSSFYLPGLDVVVRTQSPKKAVLLVTALLDIERYPTMVTRGPSVDTRAGWEKHVADLIRSGEPISDHTSYGNIRIQTEIVNQCFYVIEVGPGGGYTFIHDAVDTEVEAIAMAKDSLVRMPPEAAEAGYTVVVGDSDNRQVWPAMRTAVEDGDDDG